jgi:hypothetical protein
MAVRDPVTERSKSLFKNGGRLRLKAGVVLLLLIAAILVFSSSRPSLVGELPTIAVQPTTPPSECSPPAYAG